MKALASVNFGFIFAAILLINNVSANCNGDLIVHSQQDLDQARSCKTYSGNIRIEGTSTTELKLNGVELLEGDLIVANNDALQSISFPRLQGINGQLQFSSNKLLSKIGVQLLYAIRSLEISVHPALNELQFTAGLSQAEKVIIADTTITKLEGFKLSATKEVEITNNIYLKSLSFENMTSAGSILVSANSPTMSLDLQKIESLREATFRNIASINLNSLERVAGDISFISNSFENLDLPTVSEIAGTLTLSDNLHLSNLTMASLNHLGGALSVGGNMKLSSVTSFPKLQQVGGTLDLTGGFDEVQFPLLADVRGGLNVQTSSNSFNCEGMNKLKSGVIKGNSFICKSAVAKPKSGLKVGTGSSGTGLSESSASSSFSYTSALLATFGATFAYIMNI